MRYPLCSSIPTLSPDSGLEKLTCQPNIVSIIITFDQLVGAAIQSYQSTHTDSICKLERHPVLSGHTICETILKREIFFIPNARRIETRLSGMDNNHKYVPLLLLPTCCTISSSKGCGIYWSEFLCVTRYVMQPYINTTTLMQIPRKVHTNVYNCATVYCSVVQANSRVKVV